MTNLIRIVIFFTLVLSVNAQKEFKPISDASSFKSRMSQASKQTKTIESDFLQVKNMSLLSEKIKSKGKFYFKKENSLRWEYLSPFKYLIVFKGDKVTIKDETKTMNYDTRSNQMFKKISEIMTQTIQGNINSSSDFNPSYFENENAYLLKMIPVNKIMKDFFKSINVYIDKKDMTVYRLDMNEPSGDYTKIEFSGKKINQNIGDEKFIVK